MAELRDLPIEIIKEWIRGIGNTKKTTMEIRNEQGIFIESYTWSHNYGEIEKMKQKRFPVFLAPIFGEALTTLIMENHHLWRYNNKSHRKKWSMEFKS